MNALRINYAYKVISHSEMDGFRVDHFCDLEEANAFAKDVSAAGFSCMVCKALTAFDPGDLPQAMGW
jgi:hypothetical protein